MQGWIGFTALLYLAAIFGAWFLLNLRSLGGVFIGILAALLIQYLWYEPLLALLAAVV